MLSMKSTFCLPLALALATAAVAQDDLRDVIELNNGRTVRGRVVAPFAAGELVVLQGGKRTRVERRDITAIRLVADDVRDFFERRVRHQNSPRALRYLVDWAVDHHLEGLAKLQALELLLQDDSDERLHELLGHKRRGSEWRWPHDGKFVTFDKLKEAMRDEPLELAGERFRLRCDAGLLTNVRALFDLEQLGVAWFDRFGKALDCKEVLEPITVRTWRGVDDFPKWGFRPEAYFEPPPHGDEGRTFYAGPTPTRPERLFFVGTQGLLHRSLIGEVNQQDRRDRTCPWLEVGLGMHMQDLMQGPAGFAVAGEPRQQDRKALQAIARSYRLTHLVHLPMYGSFYLTSDGATAANWDAATMFVAFLLRDDNKPKTREAFFRYARAALAEGQGDSSSAFDRLMGRPIEQFEEPWRKWLHELAGF